MSLLTYPDLTAVDVAAMLPDFVAGFAAHVTFGVLRRQTPHRLKPQL